MAGLAGEAIRLRDQGVSQDAVLNSADQAARNYETQNNIQPNTDREMRLAKYIAIQWNEPLMTPDRAASQVWEDCGNSVPGTGVPGIY